MSTIRDPEEDPRPKINRGMEFMLRNKKQTKEELFRFIIDKSFSFLKKEIYLKFEFRIKEKILR